MGELLLRLFGIQEPDPRAFLGAGLGQDEAGAALEDQLKRRRLWAGLTSLQVLEPPGRHQMHQHDELAVLRREEEALRAPLGACQAAPLERGQRRVERLQRGDVRGTRPDDRKSGDRIVERPPPRFDLGKLRHRRSLGSEPWSQSGYPCVVEMWSRRSTTCTRSPCRTA